jgi:uncharacterized membrane protein
VFAFLRFSIPALLLAFLPLLLSLIAGGRVVPWTGIWMMMPSIILLLALIALVNLIVLVCLFIFAADAKNGSRGQFGGSHRGAGRISGRV